MSKLRERLAKHREAQHLKYITQKQNQTGGKKWWDGTTKPGTEAGAAGTGAGAGAGAGAAEESTPLRQRRGAAPSAADLAAFEAARPMLGWRIKAPLLLFVLLGSGFLGWAVMGLIFVVCYMMYEFTDGSGRQRR